MAQNREQKLASRRRRRIESRRRMAEYLIGKKCMDCGISNPMVFEFDHVRGNKFANISDLLGKSAWSKVVSEISKCDIVCANCHRIRTSVRAGDYRARASGLCPGGQLPLL